MRTFYFIFAFIGVAQAISSGHNTTIMRHQWQLSLRHKGEHFCGASLISKQWALTSASCLNQHTSDLSVRAGSANLTSGGYIIDVDDFVIHPKYNKKTYNSDIALLKFAKEVEGSNVSIALVPFHDTSDVSDHKGVAMTGWGALEQGENFTEVLQMGYPSSISRSSCQMAYPTKIISLNMFCAGVYDVQNITACDGDFGGPATFTNCLQGIISWGGQCGSFQNPTVMTRVAAFKDWILTTTGATDYLNCPLV
ncbi:trypsin [Diabrotica virgifera virgifera]|uniref:Trypsin-like n=1 Tax=Diabrotica virgifera virgifera TaxID=50390 RepID=A0A6P7FCQ5_DIAVI|nr:trypsin [Diabrotica virgifera virgifera]